MSLTLDHPGARFVTPLTEGRRNHGHAVSRLAHAFGYTHRMPWQRHVWALHTEELEPHRWAYDEVIVTVPRRGGKTAGRHPLVWHRALIRPGCRLWLTAQTRQDARDIIVDEVQPRVKRAPGVLARSARLRRSQGSEGWHFTNGSTWRVFAPNDDALHGKDSELVDVDEGWSFSAVEGANIDQGIAPTLLTTGGQVSVFSTMGTKDSVWFHGKVESARAALAAGMNTGVAIIDMGVPLELRDELRAQLEEDEGSPPYMAALATIAEHHPAWGHTITRLDRFAAVARALKLPEESRPSPDAILRALGNLPTSTITSLIPSVGWSRLAPDSWPAPAGAVLAVAVGIDGADAAICAAWRTPAGVALDVIDYRPGSSWVLDRLDELAPRWGRPPVAIDKIGPGVDMHAALERAGYYVVSPTSTQYAGSCGAILTAAIDAGRGEPAGIVHPNHPDLNAAVPNAAKRTLGDGLWAWSRVKSSASITCLEGVTVARWAALEVPVMGAPVVGGVGR
jgi:hypothetical protein